MNTMLLRRVIACVFVSTICAVLALGQSAAVTGAGYEVPTPLTVAPGQVVTVFVSGLGSDITQRIGASTTPLPTILGGISAWITPLSPPQQPIAAPLLAVFPVNSCTGGLALPCSALLGVVLQVPFEIGTIVPGAGAVSNSLQLSISDGTVTSGAVQLVPASDRVHVLRYGDTILPNGGVGPVVAHADGSLVSSASPANVGEYLVMYAVGLGLTSPAVRTGEPTPLPGVETVSTFSLIFDYRPNATPASMLISPQLGGHAGTIMESAPLFSGLVAGMAGLYQVNFQVPATSGALPACGVNSVTSNLTITLVGATSFDGAGICVNQQ